MQRSVESRNCHHCEGDGDTIRTYTDYGDTYLGDYGGSGYTDYGDTTLIGYGGRGYTDYGDPHTHGELSTPRAGGYHSSEAMARDTTTSTVPSEGRAPWTHGLRLILFLFGYGDGDNPGFLFGYDDGDNPGTVPREG